MDAPDRYRHYESVFAGIDAPFAFVDLEAVAANAVEMLGRAGNKPIRVASKSIRCRRMLERCLNRDPRFRGLLCFTLPEALWLAEQGHSDLVVAYPSVDRSALSRLAELASERPGQAPVLMVDDRVQLDLIEGASGRGPAPVEVAIELDVGWRPAGRRGPTIGPLRSPVRTPDEARSLAEEISQRPGVSLVGLMAYEGQIAGVGDRTPGQPLRNRAMRLIKRRSMSELRERRAEVIAAVREVAELRFVNAGGTGSLHLNADDPSVDELAAGSGFYAPVLFDYYRDFSLTPAAGFALPVVRRSDPGTATLLGGGYIASGAAGPDRLPEPYLPEGLRLHPLEGAGEVQTPVVGPSANSLRIGDRAYLRHAKAGELCERFDSLYLIEGDRIVEQAPTYRGEGRTFL